MVQEMMMEISEKSWYLRPCQREDLPVVAEIEQTCFSPQAFLPLIAITQYFEMFHELFVVAESARKVIGFGLAGKAENEPTGWLLSVCVLKDYRHQGIANSILEWRLERLKQRGIQIVRVTASPNNEAQVKRLIVRGFKVVKEIDGYFGKNEKRILLEMQL